MEAKKKLLSRLALGAAVVLVVAAAVCIVSLLIDRENGRRFADERARARQQRLESSRGYLSELAERIDRLPVDPVLEGEIEARYFEERADGPIYVWAMDTDAEFSFGVPRAVFGKLNAVYDREVTPRLKEGVFLDRQTFLLSLVDDADEIAAGPATPERTVTELVERGRRWRLDRWEAERSFVLSTPLKAKDGKALGSLYLKRTLAGRQAENYNDHRVEAAAAVSGAVAAVAFVFLWLLLPTWVYVDARERGVRRAPIFAFLTAISSLVGFVVYLIARPEHTRLLSCPGCAREVNGGAFCPHCGRDLSASYCPACRYPLKPDWTFCPACRTEIKPVATAAAPVPEAG